MKKFYSSILASVGLSLSFFSASAQPPTVSITGTPCANSTLTLNSSVLPTKIVWSYNGSAIDSSVNSWQSNAQTLATTGSGVPIGVALDKNGNMYYSDGYFHIVKKLSVGSSTPVIVAGVSGSSGSASNLLNGPAGIFVDASGNIYIAEEGNNRVTKWGVGLSNGVTVAGTGVAGSANNQLNDPRAVYVDASGTMYIVDGNNNRIMKWLANSVSGTMVAGTGVAGNGLDQLKSPNAITVDAGGNMYITDGGNNRVVKWAPGATSGVVVIGDGTQGSGLGQLFTPTGITIDGFGNLYIGDNGNERILKVAAGATTGVVIAGGNGTGSAANQLNGIGGVTIDSSSNLYVADLYNAKVKEFLSTITNTVTTTLPGTYSATATINTGNTNTTLPYTVFPSTTIASQPIDKTICAGNNTSFSVSTSGGPVANYQWQVNMGNNIYTNIVDGGVYSGALSATLSLANVPHTMSGYKYQCVVTGVCLPVLTSNAAKLTVDTLPAIVTQPISQALCAGGNVTFSTTAVGTGITYQWFVRQGAGNFTTVTDGGVYSGATTSALTITGASATMNGYTYHCVVTGICTPQAQTLDALLTVNTSPVVTLSPQDVTVCANSATAFHVSNTGTNPTYQWKVNTGSGFTDIVNGGRYSGATTNTLTISSTDGTMSGYKYEVVINGTCTPAVTSAVATLTVDTLPAITTQPPSTGIICQNTNTSFSIAAVGTGIGYQWQVKTAGNSFTNLTNDATYGGVNTNTLAINNGAPGLDGNQYRVVVTGTCNPSVISNVITLSVNTAPNVQSVTPHVVICEGQDAAFTAVATGSGLNFQWQQSINNVFVNINDNAIFSGTNTAVLHIHNAPLSMNPSSFKVYVSGTCAPPVLSSGGFLEVNPVPHPVVTASGPAVVCPGDTVTLSLPYTLGFSYQWLRGNSLTPIPNQTSTVYYATMSDVYTVTMKNNATQCSANAPLTTVLVNPAPQVTILHPGPLCSGRNEVLYATYDPTWTYQWGYEPTAGSGSSSIPGAVSANLTANNAGIYSVTVTNAIGCPTVPPGVTIYQTPTATISRTGSLTVCAHDTIMLHSGGADLSYQWLENGNPDPNGSHIDYTAQVGGPGTYQYSVVVASQGCTDTSDVLNVTAKPLPPAAINISGSPTLCSNSNIALQANAAAPNHMLYYQWQFNGSDISGAVYPTYLATAVGTYTLRTDDQTGCFGSASVNIGSDAPFTPSVTYDGFTLCADNNQAYVFFQWALNGNNIQGANSKCYQPQANGNYTVTVRDTAGCTNTSPITGVHNVGVNTLTVKDAIKVYPNPATNLVHIDAPVKINISIMSVEGRVILQQNEAKEVDLSQLSNGVYMMAIYDSNNVLIKNEKLVKSGM